MLNVPTVVKDTLKSGMYQKNHRIVVLDAVNTELFTIDNNSLVDGSVFYDERLCTGDVLKFGLCEGSSLQFQYFNHESILGRRLQCFIDVQYKDADGSLKWFEIPMGFYDVAQCPMQFDTGIRKVTAYNKLKSEYLDTKINDQIAELQSDIADDNLITAGAIVDSMLNDYKIEKNIERIYTGQRAGGSSYWDKTPFYINGDSKKYYMTIDFKKISYTVDPTKQLKAQSWDYIGKLKDCFIEMRDSINISCQNPDTVWKNFVNSGLYQNTQVKAKKAGSSEYSVYYLFEKPSVKWDASVERFESLDSLEYMYGFSEILIAFPTQLGFTASPTPISGNPEVLWNAVTDVGLDSLEFYSYNITEADTIKINKNNMPDVTLREFQSALFEMNCQFGQLNRETDLFSGINLNNERLFPAETLFPGNGLYPNGNAEHINRSSYEKLWTDSQGVQKFKDLIITYKALKPDGNEEERTLTRTVNSDGTQNYNMSSNWLFKNLVWTEEQVAKYADAMVEKMRNVTWFPFEMWCAGLPYIEVGDELEIATPEGTYTSYILTRSLKGIQDMHDTYINGTLDIF